MSYGAFPDNGQQQDQGSSFCSTSLCVGITALCSLVGTVVTTAASEAMDPNNDARIPVAWTALGFLVSTCIFGGIAAAYAPGRCAPSGPVEGNGNDGSERAPLLWSGAFAAANPPDLPTIPKSSNTNDML